MYLDDGLSWQALNPRMVAHSEAQTTAVNTAAETALFIATIPAGTLAVGDALRITSYGDMLNNSGGTKSVTFRLYQNASLPLDTGSFGSIAGSANRGSWRLDFLLSATSLTTQRGNAMIEVFSGNANTWKSSITSTANAISRANGTYTGGAENLANSMTVQLNVVMSAADPNYDFRCQGYNIEKLTA
jgi:hypothetical protein